MIPDAAEQWRTLNRVLPEPTLTGALRTCPEDFQVQEIMGFRPDGEGGHVWIRFEKILLNTQDVVSMVSRATGVAQRDIGVSGLKDRNAVTSQWLSFSSDPASGDGIRAVEDVFEQHDQLRLLEVLRHHGKLRRGYHQGNRFHLILRNLSGSVDDLGARIAFIQSAGFPNYFGPQRFGRNGKNLHTAHRMFSGELKKIDRMARGMALSSARAWLFNAVLSERLGSYRIDEAVVGDALQLAGTQSYFLHDGSDPTVVDRIAARDVHPTGPLWGCGEAVVSGDIAALEMSVTSQWPTIVSGLERTGMKPARRAARVIPEQFEWALTDDDCLRLSFTLTTGAFATTLLRELVHIE